MIPPDPSASDPSSSDDHDLAELPVHRWKSLVDDLASFPVHLRDRGMAYAAEGRVGPVVVSDRDLAAIVRGTNDYRTRWHWDDDLWLPNCTCRVGPYCKHAYALACAALARVQADLGFFDRRLARLVPAVIPPPVRSATAMSFESDPGTGDAERAARRRAPASQSPPTGAASARASTPGDATVLRELMRAVTHWERARILAEILSEQPQAGVDPNAPPFRALLADADAELMVWQLAQELPHWTGGWLPAAFEPYRSRADLAERHAARELPAAEEEILMWAGQRTAAPQRSLRMVMGLERGPGGDVVVTTEVRLSATRMRDEPRSMHQLTQFHAELRRKPWLLSADEAALLHAIVETQPVGWTGIAGRAGAGALRRLLHRAEGSRLITWAPELPADLARQGGITPGMPVRIGAELLRLQPVVVERDGEPRLDLTLSWPDGSQRSLEEVLYFRSRSGHGESGAGLVLADGEFFALLEEPSFALVERFRSQRGMPLRIEMRQRILAQLGEAFPSVRESLKGRVRHHAVTPAAALDLRDSDWLQIRLFAHTAGGEWQPGARPAPGSAVFEYLPEYRWERVESAPAEAGKERARYGPVAADDPGGDSRVEDAIAADAISVSPPAADAAHAWLEAPDPDRVAALLEWLAATGVRPGDRRGPGAGPLARDGHVGWWVRLTARNADRLAGAWERRPRQAAWFGNAAIRKLLGPAGVARAKISVRKSGVDWFQLSAEWEAEAMALTEEDLARLRAAPTRWVKLSGGWVRREAADDHDATALALADLGLEPGAGDQRVTLWQLAAAHPESFATLERLGADPDAVRAIERLRERVAEYRGLPPCPVPAAFVGELRHYQREGLDFLAWTSSLGLGAVLADDMGLGKTIQALAWIQHLRANDPAIGPCLVVCPTSVVHNWLREAIRFAPELGVLVLESGEERHALRAQIPRHHLLITSYALLRRDLEAWKETPLGAVILDEAQNIKNPNTTIAHAVRELDARHRLALTGTPLENRALDLWSIMEFVNPGYLGTRAHFADVYDRVDAPPHVRRRLGARLRPVLLRRLKREVATDLPERIEERRDSGLTRGQRQLYLDELKRGREIIMQMALDPDALRRNKLSILTVLTRLRQICCHPALIGAAPDVGSGKFDALFELLEPLLAEGHKVLVFSQFVECLKLLAAEMAQRGVPHHMLTGQTTRREEVVDAFQADARACAFLVSLKAGGTGLNLTAASYVVLFDPWWNPAVEAQAIDRTHRIGQDRTVIAYRLIAEGTIEERIWELQQKKAALVKDVLGEEGFARSLSREDLEFLLTEM